MEEMRLRPCSVQGTELLPKMATDIASAAGLVSETYIHIGRSILPM